MKVLILSQYYDPEPVPKAPELARALRDGGHAVEAITGFPNYPSGDLYSGYRLAPVRRETIDGIPVVRAFEYPYHGRSVVKRLVNFWSFALAAPLASLFTRRADVMYVWHPPLTIGVAAWLISRIRRVPFVYDVQDIWPESALLSGMLRDGAMVRLMFVLERFVYRRAAHILCVTEGARQNIIGKGVSPEKVSVMNHWVDESLFTTVSPDAIAALRAEHGWGEDFVVLFAGNLGLVQGLDSVLAAARHLESSRKIRIVFVGDGADRERLRGLASEWELGSRVQFIDRQPMTSMPRFMAAADVLLVHLRHSELSRYVIPSKTLAYLAAGKPIVMAMEGAAADLIAEARAGTTLRSDEPEALAAELNRLASLPEDELRAYGEAGKAYLQKHMTKETIVSQYVKLLERVARRS